MKYENILIVDDSSTSRMIIKRCLEISGYNESTFLYAENGLEALSIIDNTKIDLILTDLNMPKMDGDNFIKKIKSYNKRFCKTFYTIIPSQHYVNLFQFFKNTYTFTYFQI